MIKFSKANREYICQVCQSVIHKGEEYVRTRSKFKKTVIRHKSCRIKLTELLDEERVEEIYSICEEIECCDEVNIHEIRKLFSSLIRKIDELFVHYGQLLEKTDGFRNDFNLHNKCNLLRDWRYQIEEFMGNLKNVNRDEIYFEMNTILTQNPL